MRQEFKNEDILFQGFNFMFQDIVYHDHFRKQIFKKCVLLQIMDAI